MDIEHSNDLVNLLCGKLLGQGTYRKVFELAIDGTKVVKHDNGRNWSNISEWQLSVELHDTPIGKWLAPCHWISPGGLWLIQARTTPILPGDLPTSIPAIFADTKAENWGWFEGRPVCHDYGNHRAFILAGKTGSKLRAAIWHDELG